MRTLALAILLVILAGCGAPLPADPLVQGAVFNVTETARVDATNNAAAGLQRLYLAQTQDAAVATATQAASEWRATQTYRAQTAQAWTLTQAVGTATVAAYEVERTEMARIERAYADLEIAERQAEATAQAEQRDAWTRTVDIGGWVLDVLVGLAGLAFIFVCYQLGQVFKRQQLARALILEAAALQKRLMYSEDGTYAHDGRTWVYASPRNGAPVNVEMAAPAQSHNPHIGRMSIFLHEAMQVAGAGATYMPGHREMGIPAPRWDEITNELVAKNLIPNKQHGAVTKLYGSETLRQIYNKARQLEQPPSPPPPAENEIFAP